MTGLEDHHSVASYDVYFFPMASLHRSRTQDLNYPRKAEVYHIIFLLLWVNIRWWSVGSEQDCSGYVLTRGFPRTCILSEPTHSQIHAGPHSATSSLGHQGKETKDKPQPQKTKTSNNKTKPLELWLINVPVPPVFSCFILRYKLVSWLTQVSKNGAPGVSVGRQRWWISSSEFLSNS